MNDMRKLLIEARDAVDKYRRWLSHYRKESADLISRIDAALAEKVEPIEWIECQDFYEVCQAYRHAKDGVSSNEMPTAAEAFANLKHYIVNHAAPASQWRRVEDERMIFANALKKIIDFPINGEEAAQLKLIAIDAFTDKPALPEADK